MDIKKEIGKAVDNLSAKDLKEGLDAAKEGVKKLNNEKVSKAVDKIKVSDKDLSGALDMLKKKF